MGLTGIRAVAFAGDLTRGDRGCHARAGLERWTLLGGGQHGEELIAAVASGEVVHAQLSSYVCAGRWDRALLLLGFAAVLQRLELVAPNAEDISSSTQRAP